MTLMTITRVSVCAALTLLFSACGGAPYVDSRREAGQTTPVGMSTPDRVAICYSSRSTTQETLLQMANVECAKTNRAAQYEGQDGFACVMFAPTRAFFRCVPRV
jgi:hypothetical protein